MARSPNCTGAPIYRGRVDVTIGYPDPDIVTLDTPEALPTSEPATAQVSMTVGSQHLATWSPFELEHTNVAILYVAGKNTTGSAGTVYHRIEKNGQSIATGSRSISAGYIYTWNHGQFPDVAAGDVLTCKLWANVAGFDWSKEILAIWPDKIGPKGSPIAELVVRDINDRPISADGSHTNYCPLLIIEDSSPSPSSASMNITSDPFAFPLLCSGKQYGLLRANMGGYATKSYCYYGQYFPSYETNRTIGRISYTPLNLRV